MNLASRSISDSSTSSLSTIPAGPEKEEIRRVLTLRKAPQVFEQVKELRRQMEDLQAQLATLTKDAEGEDSNAA